MRVRVVDSDPNERTSFSGSNRLYAFRVLRQLIETEYPLEKAEASKWSNRWLDYSQRVSRVQNALNEAGLPSVLASNLAAAVKSGVDEGRVYGRLFVLFVLLFVWVVACWGYPLGL